MDTTIDDLPPEVLSKIFSFLKVKLLVPKLCCTDLELPKKKKNSFQVRHRKNCSLVCKKWMYATRCPSFYRVLKLHDGVYMDEPPLSTFKNSYHPFTVIWFDSIPEFNENLEKLWKEMKESVRELIFSSCDGLGKLINHRIKASVWRGGCVPVCRA